MNVAPRHFLPPERDDTPLTRRLTHLPRAPIDARLVRRRWMVAVAKRLLPVVALALLSTVAFWPELSGDSERARLSYRRGGLEAQSGQLTAATYHGVDVRNRPYTMTSAVARQVSPERIDLTDPKGDMTLESGNWLLVQSRQGVFMQHIGSLDLSGDVQLYRDDGTTMTTSAATLDLKTGAATGAEMVHAEGPFGSLDAQGFTLVDKGANIQFPGPGRLVLNAAHAPAQPVAAPVLPAPIVPAEAAAP
jgi:lipopolysaccharide export system protein LptC